MAESADKDATFFGRWSQRKAQVRAGVLPAEVPAAKPVVAPAAAIGVAQQAVGPASEIAVTPAPIGGVGAERSPELPAKPPAPTLDDVASLTIDSDYSAFAARSVDPNVRNAAMRKLFSANPHFNVMDGLDVYIDDYSVGEPIPKSMLRQMVQARSLGLLDDDLVDQDKPPSAEEPTQLAANDTAPIHENTDLQLQRDDAAGHSGVGERPEVPTGDDAGLDTQAEPADPGHHPD
jgi:Protein of unknown function (DUF3306)